MGSIGSFIRQKREEKQMSLRQLAKRTGVSPAYISQLENNYRTNPTSHVLRSLAKGLDIPFEQFIEDIQRYTNLELKEWEHVYVEKEQEKRSFDLTELFSDDITLYYKGRRLSEEERCRLEQALKQLL